MRTNGLLIIQKIFKLFVFFNVQLSKSSIQILSNQLRYDINKKINKKQNKLFDIELLFKISQYIECCNIADFYSCRFTMVWVGRKNSNHLQTIALQLNILVYRNQSQRNS